MPSADRIEQLFHEAMSLAETANRAEWLAERCAGDEELLREVSSLLDAHAGMAQWEAGPEPAVPLPPGPFGHYRPVHLLGRGGMSAVYLAQRTDGQFEQTVALKIMASYLSGTEFLHRFQTEGRLLASFDHPNITRILDGGISPAGEPYLVLEYVEGEPLDRYCDGRKLPIEARLRIFGPICEAVDYAHRNLILHRDLKPGNILVTDGGVPKLLDFGTASLIEDDPAATVTRARMLTPRYASPEQLRGERSGVTGDVFSLGVILYELLTGAWPFGSSHSALQDLRRLTGEAVAALPVSAITGKSAGERSQSANRLRKLLSGDLSAIVMKALENEPARRYPTVRELAADVRRYLEGRPVEARPQMLPYRAGKLLRRRWLPTSAAALFIAGLTVSTAIAIHQARSARAEAIKAQQVSQFLTGMLGAASQARFDPQSYSVAQMLDAAEQRLARGPRQDPLVEARERLNLARSYTRMRLPAKARPQLDRAIPILERLGERLDLADAIEVKALIAQDQGQFNDSVQLWERALEILRQAGRSAPPHLIFEAKDNLAHTVSFLMHTQTERADRLYQEAIALGRSEPSIPRTALADCLSHRAEFLLEEGKSREGEALLLEALATGRQEDPGGIWELAPLYALGVLRSAQGDLAGAKAYAWQRVELSNRAVGPESADTAQAKIVWAMPAARTGEVDKAVEAVAEAMPVIEKSFSPQSLDLWLADRNASFVIRQAGRYPEAERYARASLKVADDARIGTADARRGNSWEALGEALCGEKKYAESIDALNRAAEVYRNAGAYWAPSATRMAARVQEVRAKAAMK